MGCTVSEPLPDIGDIGYVCIIMESAVQCRLVHGTKEINDAIAHLVSDMGKSNAWSDNSRSTSFKFHLPSFPFFTKSTNIETACVGNLFVLHLLEIMHNLGYEFIFSSDLSSIHGQSSMFFRLADEKPQPIKRPILCVAPGDHNKLVLLYHNEIVIKTVKEAIRAAWPLGIELEKTGSCKGETYYEFRLNGTPWIGKRDQSTKCRKLLLELIRRLEGIGFRFHANVNINDDVDTMYFIKSVPSTPESVSFKKFNKAPHVSMLSLNRLHRFNLINYDHDIASTVTETVLKFWRTTPPLQINFHGATEFQLNGNPLPRSGDLSIMTRQLMCFLLSSLLDKGYDVVTTLDISWKEKDKSIFILQRLYSPQFKRAAKVACISLDDSGKIRLINFPFEDRYKFRDCVFQNYLPGIFSERHRSEECHEIVLNGSPWSTASSQTVHARSVMILLLKEVYSRQWSFLASADVPSKFDESTTYPVDVHCWFFKFDGEDEADVQIENIGPTLEDVGDAEESQSVTL